jgi:opacity protein-like surface antigen
MIKATLIALSAAGALGLAATPACADQVAQSPGQYIQFNIGSGLGGTTHASINAVGLGSASADYGPEPGVFASAAYGYSLKGGFAVEVEGLYTFNDVSTSSLNALVGAPAHASVEAYGGLANLMYAIAPVGPVVPYVGAGVGYGEVHYRLYSTDDSKQGLLWQLRAGVSYPLSSNSSVDFGYRFLNTPQYSRSGVADLNGTSYSVTLKAHTELHVLSVGFRYRY